MLIVEKNTICFIFQNNNNDSFLFDLNDVVYASTNRYNLLFISKLVEAKIHKF